MYLHYILNHNLNSMLSMLYKLVNYMLLVDTLFYLIMQLSIYLINHLNHI